MAGVCAAGYLNNSKTKSIDLDNEKSALVRKCFELYATATTRSKISSSFWRILDWIATKAMFSQLPVSSECSKSFYYGTFRFNGELYEGSHEPIISKKLFDDVQQVMNNRGKKEEAKTRVCFSGFL